jgi:CHAT domain-containing protein/uncharacterized protein HemY
VQQYRQGQYLNAVSTYQRVLEIRQQLGDKAGIGQTLNNLGEVYSWLRQHDKALEVLQQALAIRRELKDRAGEGETLDNLGFAYYLKAQNDKALETLQEALVIRRELGDKAGEGQTLSTIGLVYAVGLQQHPKGLETLQQALAIHEQLGDKFQAGITLRRIGAVYSQTKDYPRALEWFKKSLAVSREVQNRAGEGETLNQIGTTFFRQEQYVRALEVYQQALPLIREAGIRLIEANILKDTADAYFNQKQYDRALEFYQQALPVAQELKNKSQEANILAEIGNSYIRQQKYNQAIESYQQALPIARELSDNKSQVANILYLTGDSYYQQKEYEQAIEYYQQALAIQREIQDKPGIINTLLMLSQGTQASDYYFRGLYPQAKAAASKSIELTQEALRLAREIEHRDLEAKALDYLGQNYMILGNNQQALQILQQAASIARDIKALQTETNALSKLSLIYLGQRDIRKKIEIGLRQLEIAREQQNPLGEAYSKNTLASDYQQVGEHQKASEAFQQALAVTRKIDINQLPPNLRDNALEAEIRSLDGLSLTYLMLGQFEKALDFAQQTLKKAQDARQPKFEVSALLRLALLYSNFAQDYPKVIDAAQQALTIARQIKDPQIEAEALSSLSDGYNKLGNSAAALETAEQLLSIAKRLENPNLERSGLNILTDIYQAQGNFQKALSTAQQLVTLVQEKNLRIHEVTALTQLSESYLSVGETTKAVEAAQQILNLAKQQANPNDELLGLMFLGRAYKLRGEYEQGITAMQTAIQLATKNKFFAGEAAAVYELSGIYEALGEYQQVIAAIEPRLAQVQSLKNPPLEAGMLMDLGYAYANVGNYQVGQKLVEQSLARARELKNPALESMALVKLGSIYNSRNEYQKALELTQQSLKIAQELKSPSLMVVPQGTLGGIYNNLGDYAKSREYYQQVLATAQQLKNRRVEGAALLILSQIHFNQGEPQKTVEFGQQGLAIFREIKEPRLEAFAHGMLSIGYGELGNEQKAMESAQSFLGFAKKVQNPVWGKPALTRVGHIHRKFGRKEEAIKIYQQALAIPTDNQVAGADSYIYAGLARTYLELNQPNVAITYYKQSVNKIEEIRRGIEGLPPELQTSFLDATIDFDREKVSDIYRQLAALLLSQGRDKEALQVQQLLREQEIREAVNPRDAVGDKPNIPLTPAERKIPAQSESIIALAKQINECDRTNCSQLRELNTRRTALITEFDQQLQKIDQEIRANRAKDDAFFDPNKLAIIQEIVEAQPGKVMIYPLVLENELWIQLYAPEDVVRSIKVNVGREELGNAAKEFRDLMEECEKPGVYCSSADTAKLQAVSQKLYNWLIKPLEKELQENQVKNLVFALDRVTRYIPMSALHDGKQYLIEKYTIYNVLTEDTSKVKESERLSGDTQNTPVLAMGVSDAIAGFNPLPNVPAELNAIVRQETKGNQGIYPGQKYLNSKFDFPTLQDNLRNFKILHLATHGVFVPDSADKSYVLLGTGEQLTIPQIKTLTGLSNIHLVVLSACQTALAGPRQDGIEIASTAYHFLNRGAQSVMASLWLVNDGSTSLLMQQFYKNLANGTSEKPMTKAEALRQAQLSMLQGKVTAKDAPAGTRLGVVPKPEAQTTAANSRSPDFSHPYYWAPFILIGNGL